MYRLFAGFALVLTCLAVFLWPSTGSGRSSGPLKEVVLHRSSDGHFYADVLVNGHSVRFLVDTGAGAVALTEEDARTAEIVIDPARFSSIGEGASGLVRGQFVALEKVDLDGFTPADVKAAVVQGASVSLLGQPFLDRLDEIVIRRDVMILRYS